MQTPKVNVCLMLEEDWEYGKICKSCQAAAKKGQADQ